MMTNICIHHVKTSNFKLQTSIYSCQDSQVVETPRLYNLTFTNFYIVLRNPLPNITINLFLFQRSINTHAHIRTHAHTYLGTHTHT